MRGIGRIYRRGNIWWIYYHHRGKAYRESSNSESESTARALLKKRIGEIGKGKLIGPKEERLTFEDLAEDLRNDYKINGKRSLRSVELSIAHLKEMFAMTRAVDITTDKVRQYISDRQDEKAANASINRELSALKRMYKLAVISGRLANAPYIPMLQENNARQGFIDHAQFLALRDALPGYLKDPITFLYFSGWRLGELRTLEWRSVDMAGGVIRLRSENSKNYTTRILPISGELADVIKRAYENRRMDCRHVFQSTGRPIGDFRKAWNKACTAAGLQGTICHDLRRTAVRNFLRAGTPERVAMALTGHKTRSIFDRYNIVSEADLALATKRLEAHLAASQQTTRVKALKRLRSPSCQ
jgi:integrase